MTDPAPDLELPRLVPLAARTLVDQVVDAIVEAAAKGVFLPGDRLVEAELARTFQVSRVPVREALRVLESQDIVVNERYRGMRLMDVTNDRLEETLKVRLALETLAGTEVMAKAANDPTVLKPLEDVTARMAAAAAAGDGFGVASLDTAFHHGLCRLSGNGVLARTWQPLSRQLTIIFGLATLKKPLEGIVEEHTDLLEALRAGGRAAFETMMEQHILEYSRLLNYEEVVARQRQLGGRRRTG